MGLPKNGLVLDSISDAGRRQKAKYRRLLCEINIMYEVGNNILVSLLTLNVFAFQYIIAPLEERLRKTRVALTRRWFSSPHFGGEL